jgi:hypothetical protein
VVARAWLLGVAARWRARGCTARLGVGGEWGRSGAVAGSVEGMDVLVLVVIVSLLAAIAVVAAAVLIRRRSAARRQTAPDLRRAGNDPEREPGDAARRAEGTQAWMRIGGGGL